MDANELQQMIEAARGRLVPGVRMDPEIDQGILVGMIDGLGGDRPHKTDSTAWAAGIEIGRKLRRALRCAP